MVPDTFSLSDHPHGEPPEGRTASALSLLLAWRTAHAGQKRLLRQLQIAIAVPYGAGLALLVTSPPSSLELPQRLTYFTPTQEVVMQTYVSLVKFTQHGLQTMKEKGIERAEMVKQNVKALGGKLLQAYYCLGEYDVVAVWEFPDNKTAMKAAVLNASLGHIQITTMPAVSRDEWKKLLQDTIGKRR